MQFLYGLFGLAMLTVPFGAHIIFCIKAAAWTGSAIALLIVGIVIPPVGWLHGLCTLFGFTWI